MPDPYPLRLPDSLRDALEVEAADREESLAEYIRWLLRNRQRITQETTQRNTDADLADRLDALEERVGQLESQPTAGRRETTQRSTQRDTQRDTESDELVSAIETWLTDHPPEKRHAKRAVVEVVRLLRDQDVAETSALQEHVYEDVADHYADARTMWNSISRYLEAVPGVEKTDYGEWGWAGDDVARGDLAREST